SARTAVILQLPPALVAEAAHHQRHRALLCRGKAAYPAHGVLCERKQRGPNHLLHLPALQPGMEKPHPQGFYTSRVTSPSPTHFWIDSASACYTCCEGDGVRHNRPGHS